jgi:Arc/MetJ-type ribon-helix-helix transcriptional regulator
MPRSKRVLFSFDPRNYRNLQALTAVGGFTSPSDAVRDALRLARALQAQAEKGFSEVVVRNPGTKEERVIVPAFDLLESQETEWQTEPDELSLARQRTSTRR